MVPEANLKSRIRSKAQVRAYRVLAYRYPQQYRQAYRIELLRVAQEMIDGELKSWP